MAQPLDKHRLNTEFFFHTPIFFKDLPNSKELKHGRKEMKKA